MPGNAIPRRVVVGTDRSETAERAVRWAASFADRFDAELHVIQVIPGESASCLNPGADAGEVADDLLRHVRSIAGERGRGRVVYDGDPAMAIARAAEEDEIAAFEAGRRAADAIMDRAASRHTASRYGRSRNPGNSNCGGASMLTCAAAAGPVCFI